LRYARTSQIPGVSFERRRRESLDAALDALSPAPGRGSSGSSEKTAAKALQRLSAVVFALENDTERVLVLMGVGMVCFVSEHRCEPLPARLLKDSLGAMPCALLGYFSNDPADDLLVTFRTTQ
jgi:hypothetical protein